MDIKTALLSSGNRKRKLSSEMCKTEIKKLSLDDDNENIEVVNEMCGISITLDQSALEKKDGKENKDVNVKNISQQISSSAHLKENIDFNVTIDEHSNNRSITSPKSLTSSPTTSNSDEKLEHSLSEKSKLSGNSSCDELNPSPVSGSINVSLNTSGLSVTGDDIGDEERDIDINARTTNKCSSKIKVAVQEKVKKKKMKPAEAKQRAEERERKQKEKLLKKQELENKKKERLLEKERKLKEKILRKEREELERKERERLKQEKKELDEKERMQKQKEKEEKIQQKLEEKKKKEEMKQKREEELRKAEEEKLKIKLEKEQKEREKAERAKAAFVKFFVKGNTQASVPVSQVVEKEGAFLPFQISDDMILAPVVPPAAQERFDKKQLDHYLACQDGKELYLQILKSGLYIDVRQRKKNYKIRESETDVIVIHENAKAQLGLHAKLLQFCENVRPPYWGTWRKKSKNIRPRNPFGEDDIFDYSVDSDDEWDEGGPGESLSGTEQEDEDENEDDYEVDNEFFVPHGYLSDEEEKNEDDEEEINDPEKQKALLKIKLQEFEMERKKKTTELKPIILGCFFTNDSVFQDLGIQSILLTYSAEILTETPIPTRFTIKQQTNNSADSPKLINSGNAPKKMKLLVPEKGFPALIRLVHGNTRNRRILAEEFQKLFIEQFSNLPDGKQETVEQPSNMDVDLCKDITSETPDSVQISLNQVQRTIKSIATYRKPPNTTINKYCWWVHENIREKYGLIDTPIPYHRDYVAQKVEDKQLPLVKGTSIKEFLAQN